MIVKKINGYQVKVFWNQKKTVYHLFSSYYSSDEVTEDLLVIRANTNSGCLCQRRLLKSQLLPLVYLKDKCVYLFSMHPSEGPPRLLKCMSVW